MWYTCVHVNHALQVDEDLSVGDPGPGGGFPGISSRTGLSTTQIIIIIIVVCECPREQICCCVFAVCKCHWEQRWLMPWLLSSTRAIYHYSLSRNLHDFRYLWLILGGVCDVITMCWPLLLQTRTCTLAPTHLHIQKTAIYTSHTHNCCCILIHTKLTRKNNCCCIHESQCPE